MIGKYVLNYEIDEIIEKGGMSTVYLGIHKSLKRKVAVKHLYPNLATKPENRKRFKNEALRLASFSHPAILTLYDYVENEQGHFIISEFVEGQNLDEYVDLVTGPMPESKALGIMTQILDAVGHIHSKNVIHRDIKSSNFIINEDNKVKVIDFGIAKLLDFNQPLLTKDGSKVGTTFFMSPQQVQGKTLDRRTDIYSLGVLLFHLLTGQYPYEKNITEYEVYKKIINEPLPDPRDYYVGVSDLMYKIIQKATAKNPMQRFQSCEEFHLALLKAQKRDKKKPGNTNLGLKTRIIEASDDMKGPVFSGTFFQNLLMLISSIFFVAAIVLGLYFFTKKEIRHVIAGKTQLLAGDSTQAKVLETLYYGETVRLLGDPNISADEDYIKVSSLRNTSGYVKQDQLALSHTYEQINAVMGNAVAQSIIPIEYKLALRKYLAINRMYNKGGTTDWVLKPENKKGYELNTISINDYDDNEIHDFACVIRNEVENRSILIIFFDNLKDNAVIEFDEEIKIKTIRKGQRGGRWFLGETLVRPGTGNKNYTVKKYEYLKTNGILVLKKEDKKNIIYIYDSEKRKLNIFSQ
ncbi:MAG: serine/threonine protein kinase [Bacteroidota bacterium]|nr:serine/threonine protein kinase [Bacteroidota bacterium]